MASTYKEKKQNDYMWLFVFFDLPTQTEERKKRATRFRKNLLKNGFTRFQYSIYIRHCGSHAHANVFERRVRVIVPKEGHVSILRIKDNQFGKIRNFWGGKEKQELLPQGWHQLTLF